MNRFCANIYIVCISIRFLHMHIWQLNNLGVHIIVKQLVKRFNKVHFDVHDKVPYLLSNV